MSSGGYVDVVPSDTAVHDGCAIIKNSAGPITVEVYKYAKQPRKFDGRIVSMFTPVDTVFTDTEWLVGEIRYFDFIRVKAATTASVSIIQA
jgi:hypothetical protein